MYIPLIPGHHKEDGIDSQVFELLEVLQVRLVGFFGEESENHPPLLEGFDREAQKGEGKGQDQQDGKNKFFHHSTRNYPVLHERVKLSKIFYCFRGGKRARSLFL